MSGPDDPVSLSALPWRVGRTVGRTIYAMVGAAPSEDDVLIGMMDTAELAGEACVAHNHRRTRGRGPFRAPEKGGPSASLGNSEPGEPSRAYS